MRELWSRLLRRLFSRPTERSEAAAIEAAARADDAELAAIARQLVLDQATVRRALRQPDGPLPPRLGRPQ